MDGAVGLYELDIDSLENDPNLKFDPQNPSAFLNPDHPNFQQLKDGLTPEQIEILEQISTVDGFDIDEKDHLDEDDEVDFIDPDTGEKVDSEETFSMDDIGFVDPRFIRAITLEAFGDSNLRRVGKLLEERLEEIGYAKHKLESAGRISRKDVDNLNVALGNHLSNKFVMESFSQQPTKINYNLIMEELSTGQTALAAGGAVIGLALIYKLIKWCINAWNKNQVASGAIGANIEVMSRRKDILKNGQSIVEISLKQFNEASKDLKAWKEQAEKGGDKLIDKEQFMYITRINDASQLNDENAARSYLEAVINARLGTDFQKYYSKLWQTLITGKAINGVMFNAEFIKAMQEAASGCVNIVNVAMGKIDEIEFASDDVTISNDGDSSYQQSINAISNFAKVLNSNNFNSNNFKASANTLAREITSFVSPDGALLPNKILEVNLSFIDDKTFDVASKEFLDDVTKFGEKLNKVSGQSNIKDKLTGNKNKDSINTGDKTQKSSRLTEYQKATDNFQAAMHVMRGILSIRNNIGNGTKAIIEASKILETK